MKPRRMGIGTLITVGFAMAIALAAIIGVFGMVSMGKIVNSLDEVAEGSKAVSSELTKLKQASEAAGNEAETLKNNMNKRLVKRLRSNAADMADLQKTFDELSSSLATVIESEEEDGTLLLLEIENIYENVQREWKPLVRGIASEITETSEEGKRMASTVDSLQSNLMSFGGLASKGSVVTEEIKEVANLSAGTAKKTSSVMLGVLIFAVIGVFITGYFTKRGILNPIKMVTERIRDIAEGEGDLTKRLDGSMQDELGELSRWFNNFVEKLQQIIAGLAVNSSALAENSRELTSSSAQISEGSEAQNLRATQVATATQELSSTITEIVRNVTSAADVAEDAASVARDGGKIVTDTIESMNGIAVSARESSDIISMLGNSSHEIGNIIRVINDIADQTNLLALNAAIEAARAGEQGRGFAVVADEVRKLAEKTVNATKEIGGMIKSMQEKTSDAIRSMENEVNAVADGVNLATGAGESLREIVEKVELVTSMVNQISTASRQQSDATEQISGDIETVAEVISETASSAGHIQRLGSEIDELATSLKATVERFKVTEGASSGELSQGVRARALPYEASGEDTGLQEEERKAS